MGKKKSKSSRKGKKEWRANISTEDIEDYFEKSTKDALSGGPLADLPSENLFFLDKSKDLSVKRKIEKHREKVLRYESVLQKNAFVQPVPSSKQKKSNKKHTEVKKAMDIDTDGATNNDVSNAEKAIDQGGAKKNAISDAGLVDLWADEGEQSKKMKKRFKPSVIPAVEVEPPGCSFNPPPESHQDSLARAVADEMQKIYRHELGPEPVPLTVAGEAIAEEDMYFLDADGGSDDDQNIDDKDKDGDEETENRSARAKRVTRVEQNKRIRRKELLKAEAETMKVEQLAKEIDSLPDIIEEIAIEDEEKDRRRIRREIVEREKLKVRPPRLGKHKYKEAPVQVLLSEEITGSIRKLKGCPTLTRDRYKSLEKRGLIVPTAKTGRK